MAEVEKCTLRYFCPTVVYANQKGKKYNDYKGIIQQDNKYWYYNTVNKKKVVTVKVFCIWDEQEALEYPTAKTER